MSRSGLLRSVFALIPKGKLFDKLYIFAQFVYAHRRIPRRHSGLFNDYLYFLKTSDEILDIYRQMTSDKVMVKEYVERVCGHGLTLQTIAVFASVKDIDLNSIRMPSVIKPAHGSGTIVFLHDGKNFLSQEEECQLAAALRSSPYDQAREKNYRHLRRRLICEPMLSSAEKTKDYKVFCFKGEPRLIQVDSDRQSSHKRNIYDSEWNHISVQYNFPLGEPEPTPMNLSELKRVARRLSEAFEFVRVDFFITDAKLYVGELTHCPESAHGRFSSIDEERLFSKILFS